MDTNYIIGHLNSAIKELKNIREEVWGQNRTIPIDKPIKNLEELLEELMNWNGCHPMGQS